MADGQCDMWHGLVDCWKYDNGLTKMKKKKQSQSNRILAVQYAHLTQVLCAVKKLFQMGAAQLCITCVLRKDVYDHYIHGKQNLKLHMERLKHIMEATTCYLSTTYRQVGSGRSIDNNCHKQLSFNWAVQGGNTAFIFWTFQNLQTHNFFVVLTFSRYQNVYSISTVHSMS